MTQELRERVARAIYDAGQTWLRDNPFNFPTAMPPQVLADAAIALVLEEAEAAAVHALMPNKAASLAASKAIRALKEGK